VHGRKYPWVVLAASLASALFLSLTYLRYCDLAAARGGGLSSFGFIFAIIPGAVCALVWMFQTRDWLRLVGLLSTAGVLAYSVFRYLTALRTERLSGDMWFLIELDGIVTIAVTIGWSAFALLFGWLAARIWSDSKHAEQLRPNKSLERTPDR
jgi:hypothetical protein